MNKKIITIAEIVFALVFVVLLSVFMATINSKGNTSNNQLIDTLEMTSGTSIDKYINLSNTGTVKGSEVINVATNYKTIGGNTKIQIRVKTGAGVDLYYGYNTSAQVIHQNGKDYTTGEEIGVYQEPSISSDSYINPAGDFSVIAEPNKNGVYDTLEFIQKMDNGSDDTISN